MGNSNNIEDLLKDKLSSREFEIKDAWQSDMDARLAAYNSKKRGWLFFLFSGIIIAGLAGGTYLYFSDGLSPQSKASIDSEILQSADSIKNATEKTNSALKGSSENYNSTKINKDSDSISNSKRISNVDSSLDLVKGKENLNQHEESLINSNSKENKANQFSDSGYRNLKNNKDSKSETENQKESKSNKEEQPFSPKFNFGVKMIDVFGNYESDEFSQGKEESIMNEFTDFGIVRSIPLRFGLLPFEYSKLSFSPIQTPFVPSLKRKESWEFSLSAGLNNSYLNNNKFSSSHTDYNEIITSHSGKNLQLDARIGKKLNSRMILQSGLSLTTYSEDLTYSPIKTTETITGWDFFEYDEWVIDSTGQGVDSILMTFTDSVFIEMDSTIYDNRPLDFNGKRTHTYLEIPLGIKFKLPIKHRLSLDVAPELAIGFLVPNSENKVYYQDVENPELDKKKIFIPSLTTGFSYNLGLNHFIMLSSRMRFPVNNFHSTEILDRRYFSFSVNAGIGVRF